jgi:uncharacterized protein with FMN-binding domain
MDQPDPRPQPATPEKGRAPSNKIANGLVALSSAAILTVYAAGYLRTRSAADRFAVEAADLRNALPVAGPASTATAAAPREFVEAGKPDEAAPLVPAAPARKSEASLPPSEIASPEASPEPVADATEPASSKEPVEEPSAAPTAANPVPAAVDATTAEPPAPPPVRKEGQLKDGTYSGWGYSRHGDIQAAVVVQDGRVVSAEITQCLTRYSCDVIDMLPAQVISRQNAFVDLISGATESANAYSNAIFRALVSSKK